MNQRLSDASDSDWGEDADSGKSIQPENFPNSVAPNQSEYDVQWIDIEDEEGFALGTIPFVVDMGARKIFLAPEGSLHAQIMQVVGGELIGPLHRGYVSRVDGSVKIPACSEKDLEEISKALVPFVGQTRFGRIDKDPHVCPQCDELIENCKCLSWGEGADWATDPIDQSSIREMKPGIQASRKTSLYMFHVSPSINRDLIASEGLTGQERGLEESGIESPWKYKTWDQPPGNYFFPNKQDAYAYVRSLNQSGARSEVIDETGGEFDIYQVDVDGLPMFTDPEAQIISDEGPSNLDEVGLPNDPYDEGFGDPARAVTPAGVSPRRLRLIDTVSKDNLDYHGWDFDGMPEAWERLPMTEVPWPGHDLNPQERAAAWDKPLARLSPRESSYVLGHAQSN